MRTYVLASLTFQLAALGSGLAQDGTDPALDQPSVSEPSKGMPVDDFGFWLGTWDVQNFRRDRTTGEWSADGQAEAAITQAFGGRLVVEQWNGTSGAFENTFGISLRYFDESLKRWVVLLSWPSGNPVTAGFSQMQGVFEDGMCTLYPPSLFTGKGAELSGRATRFVFSDAAEDSCLWTMQIPSAEDRWTSVWQMQFQRTGMPESETHKPFEVEFPPQTCACSQSEARALDRLVGEWTGEDGFSVRVTSVNRGCGVFVALESPGFGEFFGCVLHNLASGATMSRFVHNEATLSLESWGAELNQESSELVLSGGEHKFLFETNEEGVLRVRQTEGSGDSAEFVLERVRNQPDKSGG
ncbi:MAG: hypothetical protein ED559_10485 [Phycisphaera sp.]|nr:MAG: hypothetical protein ED559_10485 [Phycisphaera sp.]